MRAAAALMAVAVTTAAASGARAADTVGTVRVAAAAPGGVRPDDGTIAFDLPAMRLEEALRRYGISTGRSLFFDTAQVSGRTMQRARAEQRQNLPSIINVQILGFGEAAEPGAPASAAAPGPQGSYTPRHMVQVLARGNVPASQVDRLTEDERRHLGL